MNDRRAAFPSHDPAPQSEGHNQNQRNILDGFWTRTENEPIEEVHRRYYILLVIGVILVGAVSFVSPVRMMRALHCDKDYAEFTYSIVSAGAPAEETVLPQEAVALIKEYSTAHIVQKDAVFDADGIVIYPQEDTNYALYLTQEESFVYATDRNKFRYQVKDDGALYQAVLDCIESK